VTHNSLYSDGEATQALLLGVGAALDFDFVIIVVVASGVAGHSPDPIRIGSAPAAAGNRALSASLPHAHRDEAGLCSRHSGRLTFARRGGDDSARGRGR